MEFGPFDAAANLDRFSTSDEVSIALSSMRDILLESSRDTMWAANSGNGFEGSTEAEVAELLIALEKLDGTIN